MSRRFAFSLASAAALAAVWSAMPAHERRYLANILRQVPQLPGRYAV
jgi:hypothetical protein